MPTNFTGVTVVLSVVDSNNNCRQIGTTTTDENGAFSYTWTPDITGNFAVYATFEGTNGYYPSSAESSFNVMAAAADTNTITSSISTNDRHIRSDISNRHNHCSSYSRRSTSANG